MGNVLMFRPRATGTRFLNAEGIFRAALAAEEREEVEEALELYREAAERDPNRADICLNIGAIYLRRKEIKIAKQHLERAHELDPDYALAHYNLAQCFEEEPGGDTKALEHYRTCVRLDPRYADAHLNLALLCEKHRLIREAQEHCWLFLSNAPANDPQRRNAELMLWALQREDIYIVAPPLRPKVFRPHSRSARRRQARERAS